MIPILYDSNETAFQSNGIGRLVDCLRCEVTEERNGIFEVEFDYPITGPLYDEIIEGRIIATIHDDNKDVQPFDIYGRSAPIDGVVTFFAHHVSYRLQYSILQPFTATSCADALEQMVRKCVTPCPFTFWTDKTTAGNFKVSAPVSVKEILGGVQGSILDVYGKGEYEWDMFEVKLHLNRGTDTGVRIRYGKNLVDLTQDVDTSGFYSAVVPYWIGGENESTIVTLPEWVVLSDAATAGTVPTNAVPLDLSDQWEEAPTAADLRAKALARVNSSEAWLPDENIKVDFVALWQTEEYANIAPLEKAKLCDRVSVICPELGLVAEGVQVIKTVCDGLLERYVSMELGKARTSFASVIQAAAEAAILPQVPTKSFLKAAVDAATEEITGAKGGNFVFTFDANGKPTGWAMLDTDSTSTATNVWRFTAGGLGHSSNGFNGPFNDIALTASGKINAEMITVGTMSASIIHGGVLTLGGLDNGNGSITLLNAANAEIGRIDNSGASLTGDLKILTNGIYCEFVEAPYWADLLNYQSGAPTLLCISNGVPEYRKKYGAYLYGHNDQGVLLTRSRNRNYLFIPISMHAQDMGQSSTPDKVVQKTSVSGLVTQIHSYNVTNGVSSSGPFLEWGADYLIWASTINGRDSLLSYAYMPSDAGKHFRINQRVISAKASSDLYFYIASDNIASSDRGMTIHISSDTEMRMYDEKLYISGKSVEFASSSSRRYKHSITTDLAPDLDPHRLYNLQPVQFIYNDGHPLQHKDMKGRTLPGFIAEDVAEIYPAAVIHGDDGQVESWDERRIIPGLLALVQEQKKEIDELKTAVNELRELIRTNTLRKEDDGK